MQIISSHYSILICFVFFLPNHVYLCEIQQFVHLQCLWICLAWALNTTRKERSFTLSTQNRSWDKKQKKTKKQTWDVDEVQEFACPHVLLQKPFIFRWIDRLTTWFGIHFSLFLSITSSMKLWKFRDPMKHIPILCKDKRVFMKDSERFRFLLWP